MPKSDEQLAFLAAASELNAKYNAVRTDSEACCLYHSFWTKSEIEHGQQIKSEWNVPTNLLPFYGNWHDLICLNTESGTVQMIDDARRELFSWLSYEAFLQNLTTIDEATTDTSGIIESESWLDF
ncbi:MAG: hypothetical protein R3B84_16055 [Zavarzinella sp.]